MKKAILTLSLCIIAVFIFAQSTIPNANLETWENVTYNNNNAADWRPVNWDASNIHTTYLLFPVNIVTTERNAPGYNSSSYCAKLTSKQTISGFPVSPGFITTGNFWYTINPQGGGCNKGIIFSARPDSIVVYCKTEPVSGDKNVINLELWRGPLASRVSVGQAYREITTNSGGIWQRISIPVVYTNTGAPDSINIVLCSSDYLHTTNVKMDSRLYVDDLSLIYNVNLSTLTTSQGTLVPAFSPNVTNYSVTLPFGSTLTPTVNATTQSSNATRVITPAVDITSANIADRTTTIVVTGGDGVTTKTYNVVFGIELSNDASLAELASSVGSLSPAFNPDTLNYQVLLPHGTVTTPVTTATPNNPSSNKVITDATDVNSLIQSERTTTIHVTAPNGTTTRDYSILFNVNPLNNDATLDSIFVSQNVLANFHSDTLYYIYTLPYGTTIVPDVEVSRTDTNARVLITPATSLPGTTTIFVEAQDTNFTTTYIINFLLANPSNDASLANLKVNDTLIAGFAPTTFIYYKHLAQETTIIPTVTAQANHSAAIVNIIQASTLTGQAEVNVTAQDGTTTSSYNVNFDLNLGVENNTSLGFNIYPMPANDYVIFNISESLKNSKLKILSTTSQVVFESILSETYNTINISELTVGYYLFTIENNATKKNGYLIINR